MPSETVTTLRGPRTPDDRVVIAASVAPSSWGVSTIATASQPEFDFAAPEYAKAAAKKLAAYQRRMARRKPTPGKPSKPSSHGYKTAKHQARETAQESRPATPTHVAAVGAPRRGGQPADRGGRLLHNCHGLGCECCDNHVDDRSAGALNVLLGDPWHLG